MTKPPPHVLTVPIYLQRDEADEHGPETWQAWIDDVPGNMLRHGLDQYDTVNAVKLLYLAWVADERIAAAVPVPDTITFEVKRGDGPARNPGPPKDQPQ